MVLAVASAGTDTEPPTVAVAPINDPNIAYIVDSSKQIFFAALGCVGLIILIMCCSACCARAAKKRRQDEKARRKEEKKKRRASERLGLLSGHAKTGDDDSKSFMDYLKMFKKNHDPLGQVYSTANNTSRESIGSKTLGPGPRDLEEGRIKPVTAPRRSSLAAKSSSMQGSKNRSRSIGGPPASSKGCWDPESETWGACKRKTKTKVGGAQPQTPSTTTTSPTKTAGVSANSSSPLSARNDARTNESPPSTNRMGRFSNRSGVWARKNRDGSPTPTRSLEQSPSPTHGRHLPVSPPASPPISPRRLAPGFRNATPSPGASPRRLSRSPAEGTSESAAVRDASVSLERKRTKHQKKGKQSITDAILTPIIRRRSDQSESGISDHSVNVTLVPKKEGESSPARNRRGRSGAAEYYIGDEV